MYDNIILNKEERKCKSNRFSIEWMIKNGKKKISPI